MIRLLPGDCRDVLPTLEAGSVHTCVTSPPYYNLRDYGTAQWDGGDANCLHTMLVSYRSSTLGASTGGRSEATHLRSIEAQATPYRDTCGKCGARRIDRQIGLEATPDEYLQTMVEVFREIKRVLRDDGTVFCNMGDGYQDKQLLMMPARLALALQADGWWLRSQIVWAKPNPMPESVTDRPTSAYEMVYLLAKRSRYYYDNEGVRETSVSEHPSGNGYARPERLSLGGRGQSEPWQVQSHRNLRNVWTIPTAPYSEAHFATFPPELAERCIRAGTSERGCCAQCGTPWVRTTETERVRHPQPPGKGKGQHMVPGAEVSQSSCFRTGLVPITTTTGWRRGCQCTPRRSFLVAESEDVTPCTVLDPFAGAGTTLLVADRLQRDAIGIELSPSYTTMAMERVRRDAPLLADLAPTQDPTPEPSPADLFSWMDAAQ